jgi:hypothetical protein
MRGSEMSEPDWFGEGIDGVGVAIDAFSVAFEDAASAIRL